LILRDARAYRDWRIPGSWCALLRTSAQQHFVRRGRVRARSAEPVHMARYRPRWEARNIQKTAEQHGAAPGGTMAQRKTLNVNGKAGRLTIDDPDMPLLYALRDNLALHGPRFGCGLAQCGACTVHVDGKAVRSCVTPLSSLTAQQKVVTLEGLGTPQRLHPVQ